MPNYSAQAYLEQFRAGLVPRTMSGLAEALVESHLPDVQLRVGSSFGIGYGSGKPWADLPTPMAKGFSAHSGRAVRYGTQPYVFVPGLENIAENPDVAFKLGKQSVMDPWGNLQKIITSNLNPGIDAFRTGLMLRPEIKKWSTLHLQDLNAAGGQINAGMIPTASRRRKLFFNDAGRRARSLSNDSRVFVNSVLGNDERFRPGTITDAFSNYRKNYIENVATALRQTSPEDGAQLNAHGIKDLSFREIKRFSNGRWAVDTEMLVNTGKPSQYQAFGEIADHLAGDQHVNQFVTFSGINTKKSGKYFSESFLHPLVGPSSYGDDLAMIAEATGQKIGTFGTQVRADVGYIHGGMAELFASRAFGDSGALITSTRMMHTSGLTSKNYKLGVSGVRGMYGFPAATTELSPQIMGLPGVADFLASSDDRLLTFDNPIVMAQRQLAEYTSGRKIKAIKAFSEGDKLAAIQKTADGIRLFMHRSKLVHKTGRPVLIGGVRATLGVGSGLKSIDIVTQGMKSGDPRVVRERWASHYASKVFGAEGLTVSQRMQALQEFGEFSGLGVGNYANNRIMLHTDSAWQSGKFGLHSAEFMEEGFRTDLASRLNTKLGINTFTAKGLGPRNFNISKARAMSMLESGGRMDTKSAEEAFKNIRGLARDNAHREGIKAGLSGKALSKYINASTKLNMHVFEGQNVKFRSTDVGATKSRVRVLEAMNLHAKLLDWRGPGKEIAQEAAGIIGENVGALQDYVKLAQSAQVAPIFGNEMVEHITKAAGGKIKTFKLGDIANEGLFKEIDDSLKNTGSMSPELAGKFMGHFGMEDDTIGAFIDLRGTHLQGMELFSGARGLGSADSVAGPADFAFIHNMKKVIPGFNKKSTTGNVADMGIIPRRAVTAGLDASAHKSLGIIPNTFNAYMEMLDPYSTRGSMEQRLWLANTAAREMQTGSHGMISKKAMPGFIGGRFTGQTLGTASDDLVVGLTEQGIRRAFGSAKGSTGYQMLENLNAGKDVFSIYKRDPVQSVQQLVAVRLQLISSQHQKTAKMVAGRRMESETMWLSRLLAGASEADFDSDQMNLFMMSMGKKNGKATMPFDRQQTLLKSMYDDALEKARPLARMLDQQMLNNDASARALMRAAGGQPLGAAQIAQGMAGDKWDGITNPFKGVNKVLTDVGYKESEIDDALRAAAGGFQRQLQGGGGVGVMHSFAMGQSQMYNVVGNAKHNVFNMPHAEILAKAKELGIGELRASQNADNIRFIYGFLKKGTQSTESTLQAVTAIKLGSFEHGAERSAKLVDGLAEHLMEMSKGVSGKGNAFYTFAKENSLSAAKQAAAANLDSLADNKQFYKDMASEMIAVAKLQKFASKHGYTGAKRLGHTRAPKDFIGQMLSELSGGSKVSVPATSAGGAVLNDRMSNYIAGAPSAMASKSVNSTIGAAVEGVTNGVAKFGDLVSDLKKTSGWGNMKAIGIAAASLAVVGMLSSKKKEEPPAPVLDDPGSYQPPLPPQPQVSFPNDGARPSALASRIDPARINRVPGQRRHFGGEDSVFMPPPFDIMDGFRGQSMSGSGLGEMSNMLPATIGDSEDPRE